jgi:transposase
VQTLPTILSEAHQQIISLARERESLERERETWVRERELFTQRQKVLEREHAYLTEQLRLMQSRLFGRSSEKRAKESSTAQLLLFSSEPSNADEAPKSEKISYTRRKRQKVEGKLPEGTRFPEHLPRKDEIIDEGEGEVEFEKVTERLAANGSPFYVKRIIRRIRSQAGSLKSPAVPPAVISRTAVDVSFLVYIVVAKYIWHLPLYRQEQMLKAQGIQISRDTLIRYVISIASLLKPIYVALGVKLFEGDHLFGDETPVQVAKKDLSKKRYSESWFWVFLGASGCAFYHTPSRAFKEVEPLLKSYSGYLQSDGYNVYEKLAQEYPEITIVGCWAHARRKFVDAEKGGNAPDAAEALRYIRVLYRVEARIRDAKLKPPEILKIRERFSRKVLSLFLRWLKNKAQDPSLLPKSYFGTAINYTLKRWENLSRYLTDARLAIDSNAVEREIRPVALGKKNWLFCASEVGAEASAILYSLIASCRLAKVDPSSYLADVLERIADHPNSKIHELIPAQWKVLVENEKMEKNLAPDRDLQQVA